MMFDYSEKSRQLQQKLEAFMQQHVYPNEAVYAAQLESAGNRFAALPLMDDLKQRARAEGLWNLFIPESHGEFSEHGGLGNLDYFPLAEAMGRVLWSAEIFNCNAPDTGNMEVLMKYATPAQQEQWLKPLLAGEIRSSYAMTEPQVASSDATNIELTMRLDGDEWLLDGRKWFITGAMNENTRIFIVMGKSDADNPDRHQQQTQLLVPRATSGVEVVAKGRFDNASFLRFTNTLSSFPLASRSTCTGPSGSDVGGATPGRVETNAKIPAPVPS